MISVNRESAAILDRMTADAERMGITATQLACGARVIDIGIRTPGGLMAGRCVAEASLGGMGRVEFTSLSFGGNGPDDGPAFWLPGVSIAVDRPEIGCMSSQYAGWAIKKGDFFAIGSGPARARATVEPLFAQLDYKDGEEIAVLILEGQTMPDDFIAEYIARKCRLSPSALTLVMAPAACLAGGVQLSARAVATGMHKMFKLGFDVRKVLHGYGTCPIAPVVADEALASALANDCVLYGARINYVVRADDAELADLIDRIPSTASPDWGTPCHELFQRYGDFYDVDPLLFCPGEVTINNLASGRVFHAGRPNPHVLRRSLLDRS